MLRIVIIVPACVSQTFPITQKYSEFKRIVEQKKRLQRQTLLFQQFYLQDNRISVVATAGLCYLQSHTMFLEATFKPRKLYSITS